jgi:hypothetical protein
MGIRIQNNKTLTVLIQLWRRYTKKKIDKRKRRISFVWCKGGATLTEKSSIWK